MLRPAPLFLALGLAVLWLLGLDEDSTVWLSWSVGALALPVAATIGLVPERAAAGWAGLCLGLVGAVLCGLWAVAWRTSPDQWLAWWTLVFGILTLVTAVAMVFQDRLDRLRVPPLL